ncbi:MAG: DNA internalization-related competence protein ComEC/Rec2 [Lachnospiraceae bacterium]|nr:DNA internalization-related competence protein ComEC/Rec2 [Lachnospiraceae bacterium]
MKRFRIRRPLALWCLTFLFVVFLLMELLPPREECLPFADREQAVITGHLIRKEMRAGQGDGTEWVFTVDTEGNSSFRVQCYMTGDESFMLPPVGAGVKVRGTMREFQAATNPGEFDSAAYYHGRGIAFRLADARLIAVNNERDGLREGLFRLRMVLTAALERCLTEEDAGIMRTMLLGDRSLLDADVKQLYQRSGIIHILAISGLHISMIGMGLFSILRRMRLPHGITVPVSVLFMAAFGEMCGQTPSAMRAIVMFGIRLMATAFGRTYDLLTALSVAAVLILLENPFYATDSGFLLSFLSVFGVGVFYPAVMPRFLAEYVPKRDESPVKDMGVRMLSALLASGSVSLITLPVYMVTYYTFPVYSVVLNVLILPFMSLVLGAGICCMLCGTGSVFAGSLFGWIDHFFLGLFRVLCLSENALPGSTLVTGRAHALQIAGYYLLLGIWAVWRAYRKENGGRLKSREELWRRAICAALFPTALGLLLFRISPMLKISFLDVGQGDGIVLSCEGKHYLIDGGSSSRTGVGERVLEPFLAHEGISRLNAVILTHEDEDHMNGVLEMLLDEQRAVRIDRLILPGIAGESRGENWEKLVAAADATGVPVYTVARGDVLAQGRFSLACLGPPAGMRTEDVNAGSTVLYLTCGQFSALFTGDLEQEGEEALLKLLTDNPKLCRNLTVLKVAHHGSKNSTSRALLERLNPGMAVISVGRRNRYGHPHAELLERLADVDIRVLSTAKLGAVTLELSSDGGKPCVRVRGFLSGHL